jgi:hypothetical protein
VLPNLLFSTHSMHHFSLGHNFSMLCQWQNSLWFVICSALAGSNLSCAVRLS